MVRFNVRHCALLKKAHKTDILPGKGGLMLDLKIMGKDANMPNMGLVRKNGLRFIYAL